MERSQGDRARLAAIYAASLSFDSPPHDGAELAPKECDMIAVHHFQVWDVILGDFGCCPIAKRTEEAICRLPGARVIPGTGEIVDESKLDQDGRLLSPVA